MAKKIRKQVKGTFDETKVKLPGEGTGQMTRKAGRLEAAGIDTKSLIVMILVGAGLLAMLIGTIRAGNKREDQRKQQVVWETQCQQECAAEDKSEAEVRRCVDRCVAGKEKDAEE